MPHHHHYPPLLLRIQPQCMESHKTNEWELPDSIFLSTCVQIHCLCVATPSKDVSSLCSCFDIHFDIDKLAVACSLYRAASRRASLQQGAQIDPVAVTCNESPALNIMSALLDKPLYFHRICPITPNTEGGIQSKKKQKMRPLLQHFIYRKPCLSISIFRQWFIHHK